MSKRVNLYHNEEMCAHTHAWAHVEKCTRALHCYQHLEKRGLLKSVTVHGGHSADDRELMTVHSQRHIDEVKRLSAAAKADPTNRKLREPDGPGGIYYSDAADASARWACGCVVDAAMGVLKDTPRGGPRAPPAFALVRPPGHHAGADDTDGHHAEGFCFYNSVAVAAGVVLDSGLAKKIVILDWDVHHGNGTQDIFYNDSRVLYISLHRYGERWYPETGDLDEVGEGDGKGMTLNVPWPADGMADSDYLAAFRLVILPVLEAFGPDLLLISAGFDAADGDAQGKMRVSPTGFGMMAKLLLEGVTCPIAAALEGGYNSLVTCQCTEAVLRVLLGEDITEPPPTLLNMQTEPTLRAVIEMNKPFWDNALRYRPKTLDDFFAEAARVGQAQRVSKRARVAPTFADEVKAPKASKGPSKGVRPSSSDKAARIAARAAKASARKSAAEHCEKNLANAERDVKKAKEELKKAEKALEAAKGASERLAAKARAEEAAEAAEALADEEDSDEDDTNGTSDPKGVVLWSPKVKCRAGVRCFAQYGSDEDELWFRATVLDVHYDDLGQYVDVEYDDGDVETYKPIKRVKAIDPDPDSSSEEDDEDEEEDDEGEGPPPSRQGSEGSSSGTTGKGGGSSSGGSSSKEDGLAKALDYYAQRRKLLGE